MRASAVAPHLPHLCARNADDLHFQTIASVESIDARMAEFEVAREALRKLGAIIEPLAPSSARQKAPTTAGVRSSGKFLISRVVTDLSVRRPWTVECRSSRG